MSAGPLLRDKVAIVTGAARGIGLATAQLLSSHGARVVIADIDADAADAAVVTLPGEAISSCGDLLETPTALGVANSALAAWGRIDILVNNAGFAALGAFDDLVDADFDLMYEMHLKVPVRMIRAVLPHLRNGGESDRANGRPQMRKIVNISSLSGTMGNPAQSAYSSAKAAVAGLTKSLARELGTQGINVNAVSCGFIDTRLTAVQTGQVDVGGHTVTFGVPEEKRERAAQSIALGRIGTPEDAAGGVMFLSSPWSDFVHGQILNVSGGQFTGMTS